MTALITDLRRLTHYQELLLILTWRDIRVRYKQSVMGMLWAVLVPLMIVGAGLVVRIASATLSEKAISPVDLISVIVKAVAWSFFVNGLRFATNSLVGNPNLVTKIAFPKEVFPLASVLSSLFDFAVGVAAAAIAIVLLGWRPAMESLWFFPLLAVLIAFTTGVSLLLSAVNLFFRDVKYIVEIILTYAIFFTPVLYDISMLGKWAHVAMFNPVAPLFEGMSASIAHGQAPDLSWIGYSTATSVVIMVAGYWSFKKLEASFAESI